MPQRGQGVTSSRQTSPYLTVPHLPLPYPTPPYFTLRYPSSPYLTFIDPRCVALMPWLEQGILPAGRPE